MGSWQEQIYLWNEEVSVNCNSQYLEFDTLSSIFQSSAYRHVGSCDDSTRLSGPYWQRLETVSFWSLECKTAAKSNKNVRWMLSVPIGGCVWERYYMFYHLIEFSVTLMTDYSISVFIEQCIPAKALHFTIANLYVYKKYLVLFLYLSHIHTYNYTHTLSHTGIFTRNVFS